MDLPLDWNNIYSEDERANGVHAESIADGLILSLNNLGLVDIEYISQITGEEYKEVISVLKGSIYQNPNTWGECFYKGWETAEEYLSGNLRQKLKAAENATKFYNGYFDDNVNAIKAVMPKSTDSGDIYVTLGTPWLPSEIIDDFMEEVFGKFLSYKEYSKCVTRHDTVTGMWEILGKKLRYQHYGSVKMTSSYGTKRIGAIDILEKTLNMQSVKVTDEVTCLTTKSGKKRVINKEETLLALEKQNKIIDKFQKWIWKDKIRKELIIKIFDEKFGCIRKRHFDGSFLNFPTMSNEVELYPYQKNAVARILFSPNCLIAHNVGSGKTYIMIAAGMELKRMGISEKNMYVVPNNIIGQWINIFKTMYPDSNLLIIEPKDFKRDKIDDTLIAVKYNSYDAIIIASSCFDRIQVSVKYQINMLKARIRHIEEIENKGEDKYITKWLDNKRKALKNKVEKLKQELEIEDTLCFDKLGINTLFVDEAHNYKNVPVDTNINYVLGINKTGSRKCQNMLLKVNCVQSQNNGRGVVFATGTPVTNSITDAYIMQLYLQENELKLADINTFEGWAAMFAEKSSEFEIDVDTKNYRMSTRLSKFHNLTELSNLFSMMADFHNTKDNDVPDFNGYIDCLVKKTPEFQGFLDTISIRADKVRSGKVNRTEDNMLKITTDGRMAALDLRLIYNKVLFNENSKVVNCAQRVYKIYRDTMPDKKTQLIFCDTSTPKKGFNIYDEVKRLLINKGVKEEEIAYIHSADTDKKRNELFKKVRKGEVRILIGSTLKLGIGVNVQDRLFAVHHLDIPWRPADMVQREGRILRQGNQNDRVEIYRYITEGSFDAYSWQLLESKQRLISQLVSGQLEERESNDIEDMALNYAEVKALAIGNPLIKKRVETSNELNRYMVLQTKLTDTRQRLSQELAGLPARIKKQEMLAAECFEDMKLYADNKKDYKADERRKIRLSIGEALSDWYNQDEEKTVTEYQGFKVILPKNMISNYEFVWLEGRGRYKVITKADKVLLARIDNKLEYLSELYERYRLGLENFKNKERDLMAELKKDNSYLDTIKILKERLSKIDKQLGVNKK